MIEKIRVISKGGDLMEEVDMMSLPVNQRDVEMTRLAGLASPAVRVVAVVGGESYDLGGAGPAMPQPLSVHGLDVADESEPEVEIGVDVEPEPEPDDPEEEGEDE